MTPERQPSNCAVLVETGSPIRKTQMHARSLTGFALPVVTPVCRRSCSLLPDLAVRVHVSSASWAQYARPFRERALELAADQCSLAPGTPCTAFPVWSCLNLT